MADNNFFHQKRSTITHQLPGFPQRAWLARTEWFNAMAPLLGSEGADAVTYDGAHIFKAGKGWMQLYAQVHTVTGAFRSNSDPGALHGEWEPAMFWPGDGPELQQMVEQLKMGDFILLFEDREAGANKYIQFGTLEQPLNFKQVDHETGTTREGKKGWQLTGSAAQRYFYQPADGVSYHPDTIAFLDALAFNEGVELTLEQELALDRLVRDLHGESNTDYTTFDIWADGIAFYPMVGGVAESHKYNLFDPQDTNASFRLVWHDGGGLVHSALGVEWDGASHAETFIVPATVFPGLDDGNHGFYIYQKVSASKNEYGTMSANDALVMQSVDDSEKIKYGIHSPTPLATLSIGGIPMLGGFAVNRGDAASMRLHHVAGVLHAAVNNANTLAADMITLGKVNNQADQSESIVCSYWFFHSLNGPGVMQFLCTAIEAFQTALGRNA